MIKRHANADERAATVRWFGMNDAVVQCDDLTANGQPETGSSHAGSGRPRLNEFIEDRLALIIGDPGAFILHGNFNNVSGASERQADLAVFGRKTSTALPMTFLITWARRSRSPQA